MIRGEALSKLDVITSQVGSTTNRHLIHIKGGLLIYFPPLNALNNQKRAMRRVMRKPQDI